MDKHPLDTLPDDEVDVWRAPDSEGIRYGFDGALEKAEEDLLKIKCENIRLDGKLRKLQETQKEVI